MPNLGEVSLKVKINTEDITKDLVAGFSRAQKEADGHVITYKIAGDKSDLETTLKHLQGMTPEVLAKIRLDFDKKDYDKEISYLSSILGKEADVVGKEFNDSLKQSFKNFNIKDVIGKSLAKDDILTAGDKNKLKDELSNILNQVKSINLKDGQIELGVVGSSAELEDQLVALNKIKTIFETLSKHGNAKSMTLDGFGKLDFSQVLDNATKGLEDQMANTGKILTTNAQQWMTSLKTTFDKEFGGIISLFENLQDIINGVFKGVSGGSGGFDTEPFKEKIKELDDQIEIYEKELAELKKLYEDVENLSSFRLKSYKEKGAEKAKVELSKISDKANAIYSGTDTGDELERFKSLVDEYMKFGGVLNNLTPQAKKLAESLNIEQTAEFTIESLTQQISDLETRISSLNEEKNKLSAESKPGQTKPDKKDGTPTTATVDPELSENFKEELQKKVTAIGAVDVEVAPVLEEEFKTHAQESVTNLGNVNMGVDFSDGRKKGEDAQEIPVDVIATPKLSENFQTDLQKLVDNTGEYKISIKPDDEKEDSSIPVKVTVENGKDFKTSLKQTVEGDAGLDIAVNPVLKEGFELEIETAVLKNVTIEGDIEGGNLKPASVETPDSSPTASTPDMTQETTEQEQALEHIEEGYEEVGEAAVESGEQQKRSLYDVRKAIIETTKAQENLRDSKRHDLDQLLNDEINDHYKNQQQKYSRMNMQQVQKKLQEKLSAKTYDENDDKALKNREKLYASILVLVEKIEASTKKPISDIVDTDEMKQFLEIRNRIEERIQKSDNFVNQDINLGNIISQLEAEEKQLLETASAADIMEKELLEAVSSVDALKNKKGKNFDSFVGLYDKYKSSGGTRDISEFTNEQKTIEAVKKSYAGLVLERKGAADRLKFALELTHPDIDVNQFDEIFKKIETGALTSAQATEKLEAAIKAIKKEAETPIPAPIPEETPMIPVGDDDIPPAKPGTLVEMEIVPKVEDPVGFANEVNKQLGENKAEINVSPKVDPVADFVNNVTEQLKGHTAVIDVEPNVVNTDTGTTGMSDETTQAETLRSKIAEIADAVDAKTNAFRQEDQVVIGIVQREISSLKALDGQLTFVLQTLEKIANSPISLNITTSEEFFDSESNVKQIIEELKTSLSGIDSNLLSNLKGVLQALNVKESVANNVQRIANSLLNLKTNLNNISPNSIDFINSIKELANQKDALQSLATVITATKKQLEDAKQAVKNPGQEPFTFELDLKTEEWDEAAKRAEKYKDVIGEIQKITYNFRRDSDGKYYKSFTFTGDKGRAVEGKNGDLLYGSENKDMVVDASKTATQMDNLISKFEEAARKAGILYDVSSVRINDDGIITFTSTVEELGDKAVTTKYKIEDLNDALNKDGSLSKDYLNIHSDGKSVKDLSKEKQRERDKEIAHNKKIKQEQRQYEARLRAEKAKEREEYWDWWIKTLQAQETAEKSANKQIKKESEAVDKKQKGIYSGFEKEQAKAESEAYRELNSLIDQYISKRDLASKTTNAGNKAVLDHDSTALLDKIETKIESLRNAGLLTESKLKEALERLNSSEDELTKKLKLRKEAQDELDSKTQIDKEIKDQTSTQKSTYKTFEEERLEYRALKYQELTDAIQRYSEVSKRIASGKALDGDIEESEKLERKISELQREPIFSEYQIEQSNRLLLKLFYTLDDLKKKAQSTSDSIAAKNKFTIDQTREKEQQLISTFGNTHFGDNEDAVFKSATVDKSGKATLTFLEIIGDQAREVVVVLNDVDSAMKEIAKGEFNWDKNATTSKWRKSTKADIFGDDTVTASTNQVQKVIDAYDELIRSEDKYQKLRARVENGSATQAQEAEFKRLTDLRKEYNKTIEEAIDLTKRLNKEEKAFYEQSGKSKIDALEKEYAQKKVDSSYTYGAYLNLGRVEADENGLVSAEVYDEAVRVNKALTETARLQKEIFENKKNVSGFEDIAKRTEKKIQALNEELASGKISDWQTGYVDKINKILHELDNVVAVTNPFNEEEARVAMEKYAKTLNNGNVQIKDTISQNGKMTVSFEKQKGVMQEIEIAWDKVTGKIERSGGAIKKVKTPWENFVSGLKQRFVSLGQYLLSFVGFYEIFAQIRKGVTVIKELDTALTEMKKVSDETTQSLKNFQDVSFDIAKSVGSTAQQIQNSTADFMRLGESLEDAAKSAEVANILLNVSEFESIDEATESLVAMSSAYDELEKIEIVDKLNLIGNNFAISTDGLATALQKSASALKTAGNDIDEAIALATASNRVVQDPDSVGAGIRTISLRITGTEAAKEELVSLGEDVDDFVVSTTSKLNEQVKDLTKTVGKDGISLLDDNGNYRSTYEILQDIADVWEKIAEEDLKTGQNRQNALLELLAGKNRSNILASILQSPDILRDAYQSSVNDSVGSAEKELNSHLDSIEGKIAQFKNEVQEFWHKLLDSEFIKDAIDFGTWLMDLLGNIVENLGTVGTLMATLGAGKAVKNFLSGKDNSGGRVKRFTLIINMPPNRLAERCAR